MKRYRRLLSIIAKRQGTLCPTFDAKGELDMEVLGLLSELSDDSIKAEALKELCADAEWPRVVLVGHLAHCSACRSRQTESIAHYDRRRGEAARALEDESRRRREAGSLTLAKLWADRETKAPAAGETSLDRSGAKRLRRAAVLLERGEGLLRDRSLNPSDADSALLTLLADPGFESALDADGSPEERLGAYLAALDRCRRELGHTLLERARAWYLERGGDRAVLPEAFEEAVLGVAAFERYLLNQSQFEVDDRLRYLLRELSGNTPEAPALAAVLASHFQQALNRARDESGQLGGRSQQTLYTHDGYVTDDERQAQASRARALGQDLLRLEARCLFRSLQRIRHLRLGPLLELENHKEGQERARRWLRLSAKLHGGMSFKGAAQDPLLGPVIGGAEQIREALRTLFDDGFKRLVEAVRAMAILWREDSEQCRVGSDAAAPSAILRSLIAEAIPRQMIRPVGRRAKEPTLTELVKLAHDTDNNEAALDEFRSRWPRFAVS